ncbi:MAG TPA: hypothetical protein VGQ53_15715 [Chitinophagaceae bacterium]|jgi:hypothetical protein|nr:hypothetical protein [Chitinophagaceae bacterium]
MKKRDFWITLSLVNLCIVAVLGMSLRTKFLFPVQFIDYKNFLNAHSHFAFGGWVTLALMILFIDNLLLADQKQKKIYQSILWGIEITAVGMLVTFPFQGYGLFSIIFSTAFIFITYGFSWVFVKDVLHANRDRSVTLLSASALLSLVISSVGPFTLAYIMATKTGNAFLYRDAIYTYLHFQYNGFFTLSVFALFFNQLLTSVSEHMRTRIWRFALFLCLSVVPALFLSLLWHGYNIYIRALAVIGCALIIMSLITFSRIALNKKIYDGYISPLARALLTFSMISFAIKMLLQMGTIIPALGNAVFGYRPIIIGFLHLVFLGLVSFYIFFTFLGTGAFVKAQKISTIAISFFTVAVILNETILLVEGVGLMFSSTNPLYPWLLWIASILLVLGALWVLVARLQDRKPALQ